MSKTQQQEITDEEPYSVTLATDDVEHLAAALEPFGDTLVCLEVDHDRLEASVADTLNVLGTRVSFDADAPHARTLTINTDAFVEAVDNLWWQDDHVCLEVQPNEDDDQLRIFDGDEVRVAFDPITLQDSDDARSPPSIDNLLEETAFDAIAECETWELAGALWTATAPRGICARLHPATDGILVEGDDADTLEFPIAANHAWPYYQTASAEYERKPEVFDDSVCYLSKDYLEDVINMLPLEGTVEIRFGDFKPLYLNSSEGVEIVLAPRREDSVVGDGE